MNLLPAFLSVALAFGASGPIAAAAASDATALPDEPPDPARASVARQFALSYLDFWSRPNASTLFATPVFYASRVKFHGRTMTPEQLLVEKSRFVRRWPVRRYEPRLDTMDTRCRGEVCMVRTRFDFSALSPARDRRSAGLAELELAIRFAEGRPYIVRETSRVTHRDAVREAAAPPPSP